MFWNKFVTCDKCGVRVLKEKAQKVTMESPYGVSFLWFCKVSPGRFCVRPYDKVEMTRFGQRYYKTIEVNEDGTKV